jgi:hypothetical protein
VIIEVRTFRIASDEEAFRAADQAEQHALMTRNRGMLRRTTAKGDNGGWLVLTLWGSRDDVEELSPEVAACIDAASLDVRRYEDLGG